ncbi:MAG: hypothetical protein BWX48_00092 [Verrucomicrobia bacterium ADurb.Bin006]|nr:MAG: hypothetical protein BWX48_00092 [Verrucomicrobia bacterium ADurb.Bin006]
MGFSCKVEVYQLTSAASTRATQRTVVEKPELLVFPFALMTMRLPARARVADQPAGSAPNVVMVGLPTNVAVPFTSLTTPVK